MEIKKKKWFILLNLIIFITTIVSVTVTLIFGSWASRKDDGSLYGMHVDYWMHVVSFTILCNIMLGLIALISVVIGAKYLKRHKELPKGLLAWYLIGATNGSLIVLMVICFLAPLRSIAGKAYFDMLLGPMFHLHFFNPLLMVICYIFLSGKRKTNKKARYLSLLPVIIYSAPYIICVALVHIWPDFYNLTFNGRNYLLFPIYILFMAIIFGISSLLDFCRNRYILRSQKVPQPVEKTKDAC